MENKIEFGKVNLQKFWGNPSGKKECPLEINIKLDQIGFGILFTAYATVYNAGKEQILLTGDYIHELAELPELMKNETYKVLCGITKKYQGVMIHAGTPEQEVCLKQALANNKIPPLLHQHYGEQCKYLTSINMMTVPLPDGALYRYGHGYTTESILDSDLELIQMLTTIQKA